MLTGATGCRYEASAAGYDRDEKHAELFHPDSRFAVLFPQPGAVGLGFAMYRFDTEHTAKDRRAEVLYWCVPWPFSSGTSSRAHYESCGSYEVQVAEEGRGRGVGTLLVEILETLGKVWTMEKVMLTVFKCEFFYCFPFQLAFQSLMGKAERDADHLRGPAANAGALGLYRKAGCVDLPSHT